MSILMKKIINVIFFLLLFSFSSEGQLVGHKTVCGKAKFKAMIYMLSL